MFISNDNLKKILFNAGVIDELTWADALHNAERIAVPIEDILRERDIISGHVLYELVANALQLKYVNLKTKEISDDVLLLFTTTIVGEYKAIPFEIDSKQNVVKVAFLDPTDTKRISSLERLLRRNIDVHFCGTNSFHYATKYYQKEVAAEVKQLIERMIAENTPRTFFYQRDDTAKHEKLLEKLIEYVYYTQPSDIHIEHLREGGAIKFRVDGFLRDEFALPNGYVGYLVRHIKERCGIRTDGHHPTREGRFSTSVFGEMLAFRVSVMPTFYGEKVCARVLNESYQKTSLLELGFGERSIALLKKELKKPHGLVLVTGSTGSGKSSTLYTLLKSLNVEGVSIATIEDPIEYSIPHVNQTQVDAEKEFTFATGLRAILRQDPNIVMVGEIRDGETASIAIQAAMTGHTVLSTLHSNTAVGAITRLRNMDVRSYLLAPTMSVIINQRLVRGMCTACREKYRVGKKMLTEMDKDNNIIRSLDKLKRLGFVNFSSVSSLAFFKSKGCGRCRGKGTFGRVGLFEVLPINDAIQDAILKEKPESALQKTAEGEGMITLFEDGLIKALTGQIPISEVVRVAP